MDYLVDPHDLRFQLFDWLPTEELLATGHYGDWEREGLEMVLDEAVKIAQEVIAPTNEEGDRAGSTRHADGSVSTPASFKPAYETLRDSGWLAPTQNPDYGGLGMPDVVGTVLAELVAGSNLSLSLVTLLNRGAGQLVERYGTDEMRRVYCEKMYSGHWTGTMCLTEPQAGSDVGASTTRAVPRDDGTYLIRGEKIFITYGEHDLAENIVHAVLARTPDAAPGTRGLSLFAVPKFRVDADGKPGEPNDVVCAGIEHKLGIHGSPTCSMSFGPNDACVGQLLGDEGSGMRLMFDMMNGARLEVGMQSLAVASAAHLASRDYAHERLQMRHWDRARAKDAGQVPIVEHPDVRRLLLISSAYVQAMRALVLRTAYHIDHTHADEGDERERHQGLVELLTPVCKAWCSDWGFRVTEWSLQVYGGYGYIRDYPAEQYLRDAKITSIYEGTNGIQALDFVGRKLSARGGAPLRELLGEAAATVERLSGDAELGASAKLLGDALGEFETTLGTVAGSPDALVLTLLNAVPLLDMFGTVLGAHFLLDQAATAGRRLAALLDERGVDDAERRGFLEKTADAAFLHNKVCAAVHFAHRALPSVAAQAVAVRAGETAPMDAVL